MLDGVSTGATTCVPSAKMASGSRYEGLDDHGIYVRKYRQGASNIAVSSPTN